MVRNNTNKINGLINKNSWAIITLIGGLIIWAVRLEATVHAMQDKGVKLRQEYETSMILLGELNERTIRMEQNQIYIMSHLGISN